MLRRRLKPNRVVDFFARGDRFDRIEGTRARPPSCVRSTSAPSELVKWDGSELPMAERSAERLRLAARAEAAKHPVSVGVLLSLPQECSAPAMQKSRPPVTAAA